MSDPTAFVIAMAEKCQAVILDSSLSKNDRHKADLPKVLGRSHLLWMCKRIVSRAEEWPPAKLHRWIGFVQAGMLANQMLDFEQAKSMFDDAKNAYRGGDDDLIDHLDPMSSFELDIGGQG